MEKKKKKTLGQWLSSYFDENGQFIFYIYLYKVSFKGKKKQQFKDLNKKL